MAPIGNKRLAYTLNLYGDRPLKLAGMHGTDISSTRMDDLDKSAIQFVMNNSPGSTIGLDAGCGLGFPSIIMAMLGAKMLLLDKADLRSRFTNIRKTLPTQNLAFLRTDLRNFPSARIPDELNLFYSQRTLHYLKYDETKSFLRIVSSKMKPSGMGFLSLSGIHSELSEGYVGAKMALKDRFAPLSPAMAKKHEVHGLICLYTQDEVLSLLKKIGVKPLRVWTSAFGNIKATFSKGR